MRSIAPCCDGVYQCYEGGVLKVLPTYLYGYMRRKTPDVSSVIRSVIAACLAGFFAGFVLGYVVFKMPEIPWFYYPIAGAVLATVFAGLILFAPSEWFRKKREELNQSAAMTFCGMVIAVLALVAGIMFDGHKHLEGEFTIWMIHETEDGRLADHGDRMDIIATIQNSENNPLSIERIYLAFGDGKQVDFLIDGEGEKADSNNTKSSNLKYYGFPVNNGEAVRLTLSIKGDEKEEIIQKANDQGFKGCFAEDTSGESYRLEVKTYTAASDRKTNYFSFAPNPKEG